MNDGLSQISNHPQRKGLDKWADYYLGSNFREILIKSKIDVKPTLEISENVLNTIAIEARMFFLDLEQSSHNRVSQHFPTSYFPGDKNHGKDKKRKLFGGFQHDLQYIIDTWVESDSLGSFVNAYKNGGAGIEHRIKQEKTVKGVLSLIEQRANKVGINNYQHDKIITFQKKILTLLQQNQIESDNLAYSNSHFPKSELGGFAEGDTSNAETLSGYQLYELKKQGLAEKKQSLLAQTASGLAAGVASFTPFAPFTFPVVVVGGAFYNGYRSAKNANKEVELNAKWEYIQISVQQSISKLKVFKDQFLYQDSGEHIRKLNPTQKDNYKKLIIDFLDYCPDSETRAFIIEEYNKFTNTYNNPVNIDASTTNTIFDSQLTDLKSNLTFTTAALVTVTPDTALIDIQQSYIDNPNLYNEHYPNPTHRSYSDLINSEMNHKKIKRIINTELNYGLAVGIASIPALCYTIITNTPPWLKNPGSYIRPR